MCEKNYCVIMAGGIGARFWPLSKSSVPKQFLDIMGTGRSFIRATFERFLPIVPAQNFFVVTSKAYKKLVLEHLPELDESQVLCEPIRRNTAPCIAYATYRIAERCNDANIVVTPADHLVLDGREFERVVRTGLDFVDGNEHLMTIGIAPTRPETGYGYIQYNKNEVAKEVHKVKTFTEKPDKEIAKAFVKSGDFLWNSGIFIWSLRAIKSAFEKNLPQIAASFSKGKGVYGPDNEIEFIESL